MLLFCDRVVFSDKVSAVDRLLVLEFLCRVLRDVVNQVLPEYDVQST